MCDSQYTITIIHHSRAGCHCRFVMLHSRTMRLPLSPHDTVLSATLRFVLELAALFCIGAAFGIANFLISVFVIALFNARGDKRFKGIEVSGPIRLMIEVVITLMGVYGALLAFGTLYAGIFGAVWVGYLFLGRERLVWLARGAREKER